MTDAQDAIAVLREELALKTGWPEPCSVTQDDARAIVAAYDAAVAALARRDAQIVAWLREIAAQPVSEGDTGQAVARRIACEFFADAIEACEYKEAGDEPA